MGVAQPVQIGPLRFSKKGDALNYLKEILNRYEPGNAVSDADAEVLQNALKRHPDALTKIGVGILSFSVESAEYGTQCFCVIRTDGTRENFSYRSCV